jgi:hypothetical protein
MNITNKTRQELASEYGIDVKTLKRWLVQHDISLSPRGRLCPRTVREIYEKLGRPNYPDPPLTDHHAR